MSFPPPRLGAVRTPTVDEPLRVLSLGAGVQSTTVLLMAAHGDIAPLDVAIFADTGWEPADVYHHLAQLTEAAQAAGIPVHVVTAGNIRDDHVAPSSAHLFVRNARKRPEHQGTLRVSIPLYTTGSAGPTFGQKGRTQRRCTSTYKVEPVERELRRLLGLEPRQRWPLQPLVHQLFGISWDETQRMRDSRRPAVVNDYPLVDRRMTRDDCHAWLADHGWDDVPRSACIGCPFHRNDEWRRLRDYAPAEFAQAVEFDHTMRASQAAGRLSFDSVPYLHDQRVPLDEADLEERDDPQGRLFDGFGSECEGLCGL